MPLDELRPILKDRDTPPTVLAWGFAAREEQELREVVLQNTSLPDEAIEALVATLPEGQAELVVINQVRLLRRTSLLEALETNPNLNKDQRRRLMELRETFHIGEASGTGGRAATAPSAARRRPRRRRGGPLPPPEEGHVPVGGGGRGPLPRRRRAPGEGEGRAPCQRLYRLNTADKGRGPPEGQPRGAGHPHPRSQSHRGHGRGWAAHA
jgi:hypothetical protein